MLLLSIIVGAFMTVVPNGNKEGSDSNPVLAAVETLTLTYRTIPNVMFPLVTKIAWKLLP